MIIIELELKYKYTVLLFGKKFPLGNSTTQTRVFFSSNPTNPRNCPRVEVNMFIELNLSHKSISPLDPNQSNKRDRRPGNCSSAHAESKAKPPPPFQMNLDSSVLVNAIKYLLLPTDRRVWVKPVPHHRPICFGVRPLVKGTPDCARSNESIHN